MTDIITHALVRESRELPRFVVTGPLLEYKFRTDFRKASDVRGASKKVTVRVRQTGAGTGLPIEVSIVKPGAADELVLDRRDFSSFSASSTGSGPGPGSAPGTAGVVRGSSDGLGVQFAVNTGTGPVGHFPDFDDLVVVDPGGGGLPPTPPPIDFDEFEYTIKEDDPDGVWQVHIKNKGFNTEIFQVDIRHPDMQLALSEAKIPFSLVNRLLRKINRLMDLRVRLDDDATIDFREKFKHLTGLEKMEYHVGKVGDVEIDVKIGTLSLNDIFVDDINLDELDFELVPDGAEAVALRLHVGFETGGDDEIEVNNAPDIDVQELAIDAKCSFSGFGLVYSEQRDMAGNLLAASAPAGRIDVEADVTIETSSFEGRVRDSIRSAISKFLNDSDTKKGLRVVAEHFTDMLMFLAVGADERVFYDVRPTASDIVVRHYAKPSARLRLLQRPHLGDGGVATPVATQPTPGDAPSPGGAPGTGGIGAAGIAGGLAGPAGAGVQAVATTGTVAAGAGGVAAGGVAVGPAGAGIDAVATTGTVAVDPTLGGSGSGRRIDHIVVLTLENRSFDHMLGYLTAKKNRPDIDGLGAPANHTNPVPGSTLEHRVFRLQDGAIVRVDPGHGVAAVDEQIADGAMSGFVANYMRKRSIKQRPGDEKIVMGFYDDDLLGVYDRLADEYLVCDRWFCSHPGATYPNRFVSVMGSAPDIHNFAIEGGEAGTVKGDTIFDVLSRAKVSWKYVESNIAFLRMFDKYRVDEENIIQRDEWLDLARAGQLPAVSWIDPNIGDIELDADANDDHPPANVTMGQGLVQEIYAALTTNRKQWARTLFVVVYDEHGGFYDHVPPHGLAGETNPVVHKIHPDGATHYGPRVPALIVSPWVKPRSASSTVFDHTSILKTILVNFIGPEAAEQEVLGARVDAANSLLDLLEDTGRADVPTVAVPVQGAMATEFDEPIERDSFHLGMRLFGFGPKLRRIIADRAD